jgi:Asp-tRNA(Asn)/Glu-tRNA(Gln) amidotransferase A subunit family amidase
MAKRPARDSGLIHLTAIELRERMASGALRAVDLARAFIAQIEARESEVQAWTWFDPTFVLDQAAALDAWRTSGKPVGALHGLPVGIKDTIDTARIPTENGTVLDAGRVPARDAWIVSRLKAEGAIIMGKTVTTELAFFSPGKTRNPHNAAHTPGGSSSGSAATVASGMVPLAIGTQTAGSVIRPAAFCGTVGFKPTFGTIPRTGVLPQAFNLDTIGVFARTVTDAALLAGALTGHDPADPATTPLPSPRLLEIAASKPPVTPALAFIPPPGWDETATDETKAGFAELTATLGDPCDTVPLPPAFTEAPAYQQTIQLAELSKTFFAYEKRGRDQLSQKLRDAIDRGKAIPARDYLAALDWRSILNAALEAIFERYDAIVTAAAPGPAPAGLESTGSPIFNGLWTFLGVPAVTLPLLASGDGLPIGVQLIGPRGGDARLLRTANWLVAHLQQAAAEGEAA